jgi:septum site-determining protein MinC
VLDCNPADDFSPNAVDITASENSIGAESPAADDSVENKLASGESQTAGAEAANGEPGAAQDGATDPAKAPAVAQAPVPQVPHVLYLRQNLRSGQMISHKGHLVIVGDVNPGAEVMADGDITIWGALRGIAHAGVGGNNTAEIRALKFDPIQLRIANAIARSPDRPKVNLKTNGPETARIVNGIIKISSSTPE